MLHKHITYRAGTMTVKDTQSFTTNQIQLSYGVVFIGCENQFGQSYVLQKCAFMSPCHAPHGGFLKTLALKQKHCSHSRV